MEASPALLGDVAGIIEPPWHQKSPRQQRAALAEVNRIRRKEGKAAAAQAWYRLNMIMPPGVIEQLEQSGRLVIVKVSK